ncbi:MAG: hypothetical protein ACI9GW_002942 [Halieaceae bacterium]
MVREIYYNADSLQPALENSSLVMMMAAVLIYSIALGCLSVSWMLLLRNYQGERFSLVASHQSYARSQIAKYLPGNVFHYAGRYALSRAMGASDRAILSATVEELFGVATVFAVCGAAAASLGLPPGTQFFSLSLPVLSTVLAAALLVTRLLLGFKFWRGLQMATLSLSLMRCWGLFSLFLLLSLCVFLLLTNQFISLHDLAQFSTITAAFCLSWLLGFLVPGAPGGIGVREAALLLLLQPLNLGAAAVVVVLQYRIVTSLGDLVFYASTFVIKGEAS